MNATKAVNLDDQSCENVTLIVESNGVVIFDNYTHGYCYIKVSANTAVLVPMADFVINATFVNGTSFFYTKTKLTPRVISSWAENAASGTVAAISLNELEISGLSGGETAAIVIGSLVGVLVVTVIVGVIISVMKVTVLKKMM